MPQNAPAHTPGPLTARLDFLSENTHRHVVWNDAAPPNSNHATAFVHTEADAKLYAAAPDLLEVLKMLLGEGVYGSSKEMPMSRLMREARKAYARATAH